MRKKWKYGNFTLRSIIKQIFLICCITVLLVILSSCSGSGKNTQFNALKKIDLDGLVQPTNQTVFSAVSTITPTQQSITPVIKATGEIDYDPRFQNTMSVRFSGRIEKLYVKYNFEDISKGQRIMDIYSPEIVTEQQNLLFLLANSSENRELVNSTKQKLRLLGLTDSQLEQIESSHSAINPLPVYSSFTGHIHDIGLSGGVASSAAMRTGMNAGMNTASASTQSENSASSQSSSLSLKEGMYVKSGQSLFAVYSMNQVWAVLSISPQDARFVKIGDKVTIQPETNLMNTIASTVGYIEPVIEKNSFNVKARVYLQNAEHLHLKIGTLLSATITSKEISGMWLPRSSVVTIGRNQIVFLKTENHFSTKTINTGFETDSLIQVLSGLQGNEMIAGNAQFMVDSESFIQTNENE
ncbi:MAG: efflux RND transporter periplasmic adaptor subunit [Bacteroidetes bacterium]|nr:efflux RND transporter periplasmic adaptor subunit [Bacteroidota bacterium]